MIREDFLHYIWQYKLFSSLKLTTTKKEELIIVKSGLHNKNSGPDFLNAEVKINHQTWVGNIEIHNNSSDWYLHKHEEDENYNAVILHVVWNNDTPVFINSNTPIPTLELKDFVNKQLLVKYQNLFSKSQRWIFCENQIKEMNSFLLNNWLERLYFERLENKSTLIKKVLQKTNNDFEAVLFQLLAKNFGLKVNGEAFWQLATSFPFSILRKIQLNELQLQALLFGQAGFLEDTFKNEYYYQLKKEYDYLKHKFQLVPMPKNSFQFFRMRPHNFPTIRIAQLAALFYKNKHLFSKLIAIKKVEEFYKLLTVQINDFWKTHYTFELESKKSSKKLTKSFVDLLIINTIIPLIFVYQKSIGELNLEDMLRLIQQVKSEKNAIISKFLDLGVKTKNAFESQALLELKNNYCTKKSCLQCAIGVNLLSNYSK